MLFTLRRAAGFALIGFALPMMAEPLVFPKATVIQRKSAKDLRLVERGGDLVFDDREGRLIFRTDQDPLSVPYTAVRKVVYEKTTHMRGNNKKSFLITAAFGGLAGAAVAGQAVDDHLLYIAYDTGQGRSDGYLIEIDKDSIEKVQEKLRRTFEERYAQPDPQRGEDLDKKTLVDLRSKHDTRVVKKGGPMPGIRPDKALIVVMCPTPSARFAGKGNQVKLHANDSVIAVNKFGTYSFAYLEPGEYLFASQAENANGLRMNVEAGKGYYFNQNLFTGFMKRRTRLSVHSPELVMFELSGAYYSDWKRKT
jgi:hypothetical protein